MTSIKTDNPAHHLGVGRSAVDVVPGRDVRLRLNDFYEVTGKADPSAAQTEGSNCMNCGAAFCMPDSGYGQGCPIYNKIPEWNELVHLGRWHDAYKRLSETNPFPEFTARVCPAPCQDACIMGINDKPIQIKGIERAIIDRAFESGWVVPDVPDRTGKRVAVIGSGPAGLAAAQKLNEQGHDVTVYEQADKPGGLLRYGIPYMKLDKAVLDRRIEVMSNSGIMFKTNCAVGKDITAQQIADDADAIILACGAMQPRDLPFPGRELRGIYQAVPYLTASTKSVSTEVPPDISAKDKDVVIIGAGDTGADCIATALRQGAKSVINLSYPEAPPYEREPDNPWPEFKRTYSYDYAHQEADAIQGKDCRWWSVNTTAFIPSENDASHVGAIDLIDMGDNDKEHRIPADLVVLSCGFIGHNAGPLVETFESISEAKPLVVAGDMAMGPSLVVKAIAEGKRAATEVGRQLRLTAFNC